MIIISEKMTFRSIVNVLQNLYNGCEVKRNMLLQLVVWDAFSK